VNPIASKLDVDLRRHGSTGIFLALPNFRKRQRSSPKMTYCKTEPVLLDDEQVRSYITDGHIKLDYSVPAEIHEAIAVKLDRMLELGPNLGNNVLPHAPEFRHILNAPEVRGALISLLGSDYIEHPHRYCHNMAPVEDTPDDIVAAVGQRAHQDSYTPMARPRQHYPRYARIIYYPRDTPVEHGPTHVTSGTQFNKRVTEEDRATGAPMAGPAGSLWITHFDVVHAAGINLSDATRHMIKFIYIRRTEPQVPTWQCRSESWQNPESLEAPYDLEVAWAHMWDWMCGKPDRCESFRSAAAIATDVPKLTDALSDEDVHGTLAAIRQLAVPGPAAADEAVSALAELLNKDHQSVRAAATYALATIGEAAIDTLVARVKEAGGAGWEDGAQACWNEGMVHMLDEAHALAGIGAPAVPALIELLDSADEWTRVNAAFALGEMDSAAAEAVPALSRCLDDDSHRVVRTALDALGTIGRDCDQYLPRMRRFLVETRPEWDEVLTGKRAWSARDQVRLNAATALARLGTEAASAERELIDALEDPCGYVGLLATDALQHLGSPTATQAVMDLVMAQRWDSSLYPERPW
jgi:HEAT repeat protein